MLKDMNLDTYFCRIDGPDYKFACLELMLRESAWLAINAAKVSKARPRIEEVRDNVLKDMEILIIWKAGFTYEDVYECAYDIAITTVDEWDHEHDRTVQEEKGDATN